MPLKKKAVTFKARAANVQPPNRTFRASQETLMHFHMPPAAGSAADDGPAPRAPTPGTHQPLNTTFTGEQRALMAEAQLPEAERPKAGRFWTAFAKATMVKASSTPWTKAAPASKPPPNPRTTSAPQMPKTRAPREASGSQADDDQQHAGAHRLRHVDELEQRLERSLSLSLGDMGKQMFVEGTGDKRRSSNDSVPPPPPRPSSNDLPVAAIVASLTPPSSRHNSFQAPVPPAAWPPPPAPARSPAQARSPSSLRAQGLRFNFDATNLNGLPLPYHAHVSPRNSDSYSFGTFNSIGSIDRFSADRFSIDSRARHSLEQISARNSFTGSLTWSAAHESGDLSAPPVFPPDFNWANLEEA